MEDSQTGKSSAGDYCWWGSHSVFGRFISNKLQCPYILIQEEWNHPVILVSGINSVLVTVGDKSTLSALSWNMFRRDTSLHHRNRRETEAGIERGSGIGRGEFMCVAFKHEEKKTSKRKRLLRCARSLFSAALYSHLLFSRAASSCTRSAGGLPSHQTLLECMCVCLCLLDLPSPTEHRKQETHESHMSTQTHTSPK